MLNRQDVEIFDIEVIRSQLVQTTTFSDAEWFYAGIRVYQHLIHTAKTPTDMLLIHESINDWELMNEKNQHEEAQND